MFGISQRVGGAHSKRRKGTNLLKRLGHKLKKGGTV